MASKFAPSAQFINSIKSSKNSGEKLKFIDRILKEIELIEYFHNKCPERLTDRDWTKLLKTKTIPQRVTLLDYIALTQRRMDLAEAKKEEHKKQVEETFRRQREIYEAGGMGYGVNLYQLIMNPLRYDKNINFVEGAKKWKTIRLNDTPKIGIDCQFFPNMPIKESSKLAAQLQLLTNENEVCNRNPLQLEFLNLNERDPETKDVVEHHLKHLKQKYAHQRILPDVYPGMPYKRNDREVMYITRKARKFFDKPIGNYRNIIVPATFDSNDESLKYCQKMKFTPIYLPIRKYIKWEAGHFYLPLPNILRIFNEVSLNGGDWGTAINNNVAQRHKMTIEERREKLGGRYDKKYQEIKERDEVIQIIEDAMKKQGLE